VSGQLHAPTALPPGKEPPVNMEICREHTYTFRMKYLIYFDNLKLGIGGGNFKVTSCTFQVIVPPTSKNYPHIYTMVLYDPQLSQLSTIKLTKCY
jgi:hypothetical protein